MASTSEQEAVMAARDRADGRAQKRAFRAKLAAEERRLGEARKLYERVVTTRQATPYAFQCAANLEIAAGNPEAARALFKRGASLAIPRPSALQAPPRATAGWRRSGSRWTVL